MKILAFDTSTAQGSVAVIEGGNVLIQRVWRREKSHSEFLTAEIEAALQELALPIKTIDALVVGQGPGSFTGIRVAINAARSLAYALQKPVYVFETSQILVQPVTRFDLPLLTIINAQKNSYFAAEFQRVDDRWVQTRDTALLTLEELESILMISPHLCLGDGCVEVEARLKPAAKSNFLRDSNVSDDVFASSFGPLTFSQHLKPQPLVWNAVQPLYLRASGAEEKLVEKLREVSKS